MREATKKFIAREVLIFFSILGILILTGVGIKLFNYVTDRKSTELNTSLKEQLEKLDSLAKPLNTSIPDKPYAVRIIKAYSDLGINFPCSDSAFYFRKHNDSDFLLSVHNRLNKEIVITTSFEEFEDRINKSIADSRHYWNLEVENAALISTIESMKSELDRTSNTKFSKQDLFSILYAIALILAIVMYPVRGVFYLLWWSIRTIRR